MREESFDCDKVGAEGNTSRTPKWIEKQNRRLHCHASHRDSHKTTTKDTARTAATSKG